MRIQRLIVLIALLSFLPGCYFGITGRVIDAETSQPIEGAVVLVEWTKTHGIGLTHTESYKVAETLSNKDGKFDLPGCYSPFVAPPQLTIYKKGYIAWSNEYIFPRYEKRKDFKWGDDNLVKMEKFKGPYSYREHVSFIRTSMRFAMAGEKKKGLEDAFDWETELARAEQKTK